MTTRIKTWLTALGLAFALSVVVATPASADVWIGQYEEHVSFALWNWVSGEPEVNEWFMVGASDFRALQPGSTLWRDQTLGLTYQKGVFDGTTWTGEGMMGRATSGVTLKMLGYRIASASATFQLYACTDFWCDYLDWEQPLGEATLTVTWAPAPGQATYGYPPSNGLHYTDWYGSGCTVDQVAGMLMWTNSRPTATWTWNGVTRTFPEAGIGYDYGYGESEMAKGTGTIVCPSG